MRLTKVMLSVGLLSLIGVGSALTGCAAVSVAGAAVGVAGAAVGTTAKVAGGVVSAGVRTVGAITPKSSAH